MNCYDFDKTIYKKDCSVQFYWFCLKKLPPPPTKIVFHFLSLLLIYPFKYFGFISTKTFKEFFFSFLRYIDGEKMVRAFWEKEKINVQKWYPALQRKDDIICTASPTFLIQALMQQINPTARVFGTFMDINTGKIIGENNKGQHKVKVLHTHHIFELDRVYTDSMEDFPLLDMVQHPQNKLIVCAENIYVFGQQKPTLNVKIRYVIAQFRVKQYLKNGLFFCPLFLVVLLPIRPNSCPLFGAS